MNRVLLTGFEAFGGSPVNPAERVARALNGSQVSNAEITGIVVPNTFFKSIDVVVNSIKKTDPNIVIMMGEYGGRSMITVERLCHNLNDSTRYGLRDNDGILLRNEFTVPGGPVAYYSTLPIRAMVKAMRTAGIPADISDTPGTNVCNHLMYGALHFISTRQLPIRAGWIHIPHLPVTAALTENLGAPSMSEETAIKGVKEAVDAAVNNVKDIEDVIPSPWQI